MTNSRDTEEYPVLLAYRASAWRRLSLILVACMIVAGVVVASSFAIIATAPGYRTAIGLSFVFSVAAGLGLARQVIAAFECLGPGMNTANLLAEVRGIAWEDVRELKPLIGPIILLRFRKGSYLLVGIPKPILSQLIAILRETTNARITGFD